MSVPIFWGVTVRNVPPLHITRHELQKGEYDMTLSERVGCSCRHRGVVGVTVWESCKGVPQGTCVGGRGGVLYNWREGRAIKSGAGCRQLAAASLAVSIWSGLGIVSPSYLLHLAGGAGACARATRERGMNHSELAVWVILKHKIRLLFGWVITNWSIGAEEQRTQNHWPTPILWHGPLGQKPYPIWGSGGDTFDTYSHVVIQHISGR